MKKTLLAIVVAILTAFIFTSTVYADSDTDASAAETSLQFGATSGNEVYLMIGNTATVDTLFWTSLGIPSNNLIQDDSNTDVAIEVDVTMIDASEDCVLTVIGNNLISGGNTIPISKFTLTASGEFTFSSVALAHLTAVTLETLATSGQYTGTFIVEYDDDTHVPPGMYNPDDAFALAFTATIQ